MAPSIAAPKLSTWKPFTRSATAQNITPLITIGVACEPPPPPPPPPKAVAKPAPPPAPDREAEIALAKRRKAQEEAKKLEAQREQEQRKIEEQKKAEEKKQKELKDKLKAEETANPDCRINADFYRNWFKARVPAGPLGPSSWPPITDVGTGRMAMSSPVRSSPEASVTGIASFIVGTPG